ncbi:MAG: hypothetical protein HXX09_01845 [Bacteroidetes bacterium]|nr:hypothetical protein [Bacteroidota bacterium]
MYTNIPESKHPRKAVKFFLIALFIFSILVLIFDIEGHSSNVSNYTNVKVPGYQKSKVNYKNGLLYINLENTQKVTNVAIYDRFAEKIGGSTVQTNNGRDLVILLQIKEPNYNYILSYEIENGNVVVSFTELKKQKLNLSNNANRANEGVDDISQLQILKK